jgi:hypothetical protein
MTKYIIEGNINFYEELMKEDDAFDKETEENTCKITGNKLEEHFVKLNCNHCFNYLPLYYEIFNQRYVNLTFTSKVYRRYFLCPYCRKLQENLLPYIAELGMPEFYGINSDDIIKMPKKEYLTTVVNGIIFKLGKCNVKDCTHLLVSKLPNCEETYCKKHYKIVTNRKIRELEKEKKKCLLEEKKIITQEKKKNKEKKPKIENEIISEIVINDYSLNNENIISENSTTNEVNNGCKAILSTGINKGKQCNCKIYLAETTEYCKRHYKIYK